MLSSAIGSGDVSGNVLVLLTGRDALSSLSLLSAERSMKASFSSKRLLFDDGLSSAD